LNVTDKISVSQPVGHSTVWSGPRSWDKYMLDYSYLHIYSLQRANTLISTPRILTE